MFLFITYLVTLTRALARLLLLAWGAWGPILPAGFIPRALQKPSPDEQVAAWEKLERCNRRRRKGRHEAVQWPGHRANPAPGLCFYPVCSRSRGFESSAFCFQGTGFTEPRGSVQRVGQTSAQHLGTSLLRFQRPWKQSGGALSSAEPSRELVCIPEEREIQFFDK